MIGAVRLALAGFVLMLLAACGQPEPDHRLPIERLRPAKAHRG